jgi:hypothetical protein
MTLQRGQDLKEMNIDKVEWTQMEEKSLVNCIAPNSIG